MFCSSYSDFTGQWIIPLPGIPKESVSVKVKNHRIVVECNGKKVSKQLPLHYNIDELKAKYDHGLLTIYWETVEKEIPIDST